MASSLPLSGSTPAEVIVVKSSSTQKAILLIEMTRKGQPHELKCFVSERNCAVPDPKQYWMDSSSEQQALYTDCENVALYEMLASGKKGKMIGIYCLL